MSSSKSSPVGCLVCGITNTVLFRCSRCKAVSYCSKEHQKQDWKHQHKAICRLGDTSIPSTTLNKPPSQKESFTDNYLLKEKDGGTIDMFVEIGSSENEILNASTETLITESEIQGEVEVTSIDSQPNDMKFAGRDNLTGGLADICLSGQPYRHGEHGTASILDEISRNVVSDMDAYGVCVVDHFLGPEMGHAVLDEVIGMYSQGVFKDGQTIRSTRDTNASGDLKNIRGDQITWLDGKESHCKNIGALITKVDTVVKQANKMLNNGKMGSYVINGRTKAMVACYPAQGSHYVKHVDNPNHDGRCITAIYYLNTDWEIERDGGLLRIFPEGWHDQVANIEPLFDRILFFWSDRRNPHEVQPSYRTRYAITLWYFDAVEREEATRRHQQQQQQLMRKTIRS